MELGKQHAMQLHEWGSRNGGCRWMQFELFRSSKSKHARMELKLIREAHPVWVMGNEGPDPQEALEATWSRKGGCRVHA